MGDAYFSNLATTLYLKETLFSPH